jgi:predicted TIM-barrel fold metal-dependent hydrolase
MTNAVLQRRTVLIGATALAATTGLRPTRSAAQMTVPFSAGTEKPKFDVPANACDCHMHIYDSRYPAAPNATLKPPDATVEDYKKLQARLGTTRNVVVTPSTYGTDNSVTLDAITKLGRTARGVAVVDTSVTPAELKRLNDLGIRGIRFNLVQAGATTSDMVEPLARRIADLGWHVQIHALGSQIIDMNEMLARLPTPIVFDHLGRIPQPEGVKHPSFTAVAALVDKGKAWIKLSGAYQDTKSGPPDYADTSAVARTFARAAPERMLWGSDWPHPTMAQTKPDDAGLLDLFAAWVPKEAERLRILVDNPQIVYDFPKA